MSWLRHVAAACVVAAYGCGVDLGECDPMALDGVESQRPHSAQGIVHRSCSGGRCHSQDAEGAQRNGAPAELDFDVQPQGSTTEDGAKVLRASTVVREWAEDMWAEIDDGSMPPEGFGAQLSGEDKETVRNWLACGAPVVTVAEPPPEVTPDWDSIYAVFERQCLTCHSEGGAAAGEGFELGSASDACGALDNVLEVEAVTPTCSGSGELVVPGDADASLLLDKLEKETPSCGVRMPYGLPPLEEIAIDALRTWIEDGAQPPTSCM